MADGDNNARLAFVVESSRAVFDFLNLDSSNIGGSNRCEITESSSGAYELNIYTDGSDRPDQIIVSRDYNEILAQYRRKCGESLRGAYIWRERILEVHTAQGYGYGLGKGGGLGDGLGDNPPDDPLAILASSDYVELARTSDAIPSSTGDTDKPAQGETGDDQPKGAGEGDPDGSPLDEPDNRGDEGSGSTPKARRVEITTPEDDDLSVLHQNTFYLQVPGVEDVRTVWEQTGIVDRLMENAPTLNRDDAVLWLELSYQSAHRLRPDLVQTREGYVARLEQAIEEGTFSGAEAGLRHKQGQYIRFYYQELL